MWVGLRAGDILETDKVHQQINLIQKMSPFENKFNGFNKSVNLITTYTQTPKFQVSVPKQTLPFPGEK